MSVVLDSTIVIDLLRGAPGAAAYLESLPQVPLCSEVTRVEILRGVGAGERTGAERVLAALSWVPVDEAIARRAGELGRRWRRSHQGIGTIDLIVAATAQELGIPLGTTNTKHFPMFPRLRSPYRI